MEEMLARLQGHLAEQEWPNVYFFKFIVPNSDEQLTQVKALFGEEGEMTLNESKTGKFVSVSVKEVMMSAESIIDRYREAAKIEGIISL